MIDQVAEAIRVRATEHSHLIEPETARQLAFAAIEAMWNPTKEMELAGIIAAESVVIHAGNNEYSASVNEDAAEIIWQSMIDELLREVK